MGEFATLVSLKPGPKVNYIPALFKMFGVEAPKEEYTDLYELLVDVDKAYRAYNERTKGGLPIQSIAYGQVASMFSKREILIRVLDKKEYHLLKYFRSVDIFDEEIVDKYGEELLTQMKETGKEYFLYMRSVYFFAKCIELFIKDKSFCEMVFTFPVKFFTPEVKERLCNEHEAIVNYGLKVGFENIKTLIPELFTNEEIYKIYVEKTKSDSRYLLFLIDNVLLKKYYLELKEVIHEEMVKGTIGFCMQLRDNSDYFKDCLKTYELSNPIFKRFQKVKLIEGIALGDFELDEIKSIMILLGINDTLENFIGKIKYLYSINDEFFSTLMVGILDSRFNCISLKSLERIIVDKDLQSIIIDLSDSAIVLMDKLISGMERKDLDLSNVIYTVISKLDDCNEENKEFIELVGRINIDSLNQEQLNNLILIMTKDRNLFNVSSAEDLREDNFQQLRRKYFEKIEAKINNRTIEEKELKEAIFEKIFGIDYSDAEFIKKRYCRFLNGFKFEDQRIFNVLTSINRIMNEHDLDVLIGTYRTTESVKSDFYSAVSLESCIRKEYARAYSDSLFRIEDHPDQLTRREASYEGEEVIVYDLHGDFRMQTHALGAYTRGEWTRPDDFSEDWNRPKIRVHGVCTSYIGNNQIATARPNGPILGFSHYEESALLVAGNYDLGSRTVNSEYSVSMHKPYLFVPPTSMIDFTRHNHNEVVLERRNNSGQGDFKRKPDYIVYIVDDASDPYNFSRENDYYQQTLQAARDFGIPVIVIDRLAYAKSELRKALTAEKQFFDTGDYTMLKLAFMTYVNNEVACRVFQYRNSEGVMVTPEPKEYQKIFTKEAIKAFVNRTVDNILNSNFSQEQKIDFIRRLIVLLANEKTKFNNIRVDLVINYDSEIEKAQTALISLGSERIKFGK
jgi:hypothetical protein